MDLSEGQAMVIETLAVISQRPTITSTVLLDICKDSSAAMWL